MTLQNAYADQPANPGGNNGTLKIHELGTPSGTEPTPGANNNDPKVCVFNLEGFGFDEGQDGYVVVNPQGGDSDTTDTVTLPFGEADVAGYDETDYINDGVSGYDLDDGHYKATLYGKDTGNPALPNLDDEKAKSKVFKVDCPSVATPATPLSNDPCGTQNDTYTIPALVEGVKKYQVNIDGNGWEDIEADETHPTNGALEVIVRAVAESGYLMPNDNKRMEFAPFTFTNEACPPLEATPLQPNAYDPCGMDSDTYTIPALGEGVAKYQVNIDGAGWTDVTADQTYPTNGALEVKVRAVAEDGYLMSNGKKRMVLEAFTFTNEDCLAEQTEPTIKEVCGSTGDRYVIPNIQGVQYQVKVGVWWNVSAGEHWGIGEVELRAVAKPGYVLSGETKWTKYLDPSLCEVTANVDMVDVCGSDNDTYTITPSEHVTYMKFTGWGWTWVGFVPFWLPQFDVVDADEYDGVGEGYVWIKAIADQGYEIDGDWFWIHEFKTDKCPLTLEGDPTFADNCGTAADTYTIVAAQGVTYKVNGVEVTDIDDPFESYPGLGLVEITAEATDPNDVLLGEDYWAHQFSDATCADITAEALCDREGVLVTLTNAGDEEGTVWVNGSEVVVPGNDSVEVTVPYTDWKATVVVTGNDEILLDAELDCTPGKGSVPPPKDPPIVVPTGIELPKTGGNGANPITAIATILLSALAAYGATFYLVNRRELSQK